MISTFIRKLDNVVSRLREGVFYLLSSSPIWLRLLGQEARFAMYLVLFIELVVCTTKGRGK